MHFLFLLILIIQERSLFKYGHFYHKDAELRPLGAAEEVEVFQSAFHWVIPAPDENIISVFTC